MKDGKVTLSPLVESALIDRVSLHGATITFHLRENAESHLGREYSRLMKIIAVDFGSYPSSMSENGISLTFPVIPKDSPEEGALRNNARIRDLTKLLRDAHLINQRASDRICAGLDVPLSARAAAAA